MSDSSKPQQQRSGATPIKNPLLSASVTGLTFDDFPNKPQLLPAAPPIVHAPVPPPSVTPSALLGREPKSLVTVGSSSLDTENLDEINLNASATEETTTTSSDANANLLWEQQQSSTSDSILSQAASSFSALPSVASNVFSSFSKRITGISSRETTPGYDTNSADSNGNNSNVPQLDIQPNYTQQQQQQQFPHQQQYQYPTAGQPLAPPPGQSSVPSANQPFYASPLPPSSGGYFEGNLLPTSNLETSNIPPAEPPKFYTPAEVPSAPPTAAAVPPPSTAGGQNNFRFTAKKKLYAPIPGLSEQQSGQAAVFPPAATATPLPGAAIPPPLPYSASDPYSQPSPYSPPSEERKSEERKSGGGLFSKITQLAPSGVLQNITGLVQSAAGTITQTINPAGSSQNTGNYNVSSSYATPPQGGNFGIQFDQQQQQQFGVGYPLPPPPATNYFVAPNYSGEPQANYTPPPPAIGETNQSITTAPAPAQAVGFFNPQTGNVPASGVFNTTAVPSPAIFDPFKQPPAASSNSTTPQPTQSRPPSQPGTTSQAGQQPPQSVPAPAPSAVTFFNPLPAAPASNPSQAGVNFFNPSAAPPNIFDPFQQKPAATEPPRPPRPSSRPYNTFSEAVPEAGVGDQQQLRPASTSSQAPTSEPPATESASQPPPGGQSTTQQPPVQIFNPLLAPASVSSEALQPPRPASNQAAAATTNSSSSQVPPTSEQPSQPPTQPGSSSNPTPVQFFNPSTGVQEQPLRPASASNQSDKSASQVPACTTEQVSQPATAPGPVQFFNPLQAAFGTAQTGLPPSQVPSTTEQVVQPSPQPAVQFFNPLQVPQAVNQPPSVQPSTPAGLQQPLRPPSATHPTAAAEQPAVTFFNPLQGAVSQPHQQQPGTAAPPPANFFNPLQATTGLPTQPVTFFDPSQAGTVAQPPPGPAAGGSAALPPPPTGSTSFRLQKGTKLYKNPLTAQETAPAQVLPNPVFGVPPPTTSSGFPAGPQALPPQGQQFYAAYNPGFPGPSLTSIPNVFTPNSEAQSVPLFAPSSAEVPTAKQDSQQQAEPALIVPANQEVASEALEKSENSGGVPTPSQVPIQEGISEEVKPQEQQQESVNPNYFFKPIEPAAETQEHIETASELQEHSENSSVGPSEADQEKSHQKENFFASNSESSQNFFNPIGPVKESSQIETTKPSDSLEKTLQNLNLEPSNVAAPPVVPPPPTQLGPGTNNPYRRGSNASEANRPGAKVAPSLANFFTPTSAVAAGSGDFNFFASLPSQVDNSNAGANFFGGQTPEQQQQQQVAPEASNQAGHFFGNPEQQQQVVPDASNQAGHFFGTPASSTAPVSTESELKEPSAPLEEEVQSSQEPSTPYPPENTSGPAFPALPTHQAGVLPIACEALKEENKQETCPAPSGPIGFESFNPTASGHSQQGTSTPNLFDTNQQQTTSQIAPPTGFENPNATPAAQQQTTEPSASNNFSNFFNQSVASSVSAPQDNTCSSFFDNFGGQQQQQTFNTSTTTANQALANEEQRIQNFFNNPPPKDADHAGDLNYDLVHSGLAIRNLQQRSLLTPISNLVEPPSSACSEFSTLNASETSIVREDNKNSQLEVVPPPTTTTSTSSTTTADASATKHYEELPEEILKELRMANLLQNDKPPTPVAGTSYKPAVKHWFYKRTLDAKQVWVPFSHYDSALLETSLSMEGEDKPEVVAVEGGRYDVYIKERLKRSVYWESEPIEVRRCSWFYKAVDSKYIPYEESTADVLEGEYKQAAESGVWHKTIILGMGEQVVFHGPTVIVHFQQQQNQDAWGGTTQTTTRPRVVKRDLDDFNIAQGESQKVDHLLFMVHGIGSACDLKLRSVEEVVEDFRTIAHQLVQSHYKNSADLGLVGRVEVLPISWHSHLHSIELGIDEKLRSITLESIPKLRNFTNDTLLDILFYTSPTFCQRIMNSIVMSLNDIYMKYRQRHPDFSGGVSLAGHSLGSLILFDLLCHQNPIKESEEKNLENPDQQFLSQGNLATDSNQQLEAKSISYTMGPAGTGQPFINYGQLIFQPKKFFALGSPIGMFVTIRGIDKLGLDFRLPTCPGFYNIFHPYDPVAYRIEALVNPDLSGVRPVLIPHHKGRKRMHLELKETMARVSTDLKHRFLDKFKNTLDSVNFFGPLAKSKKETEEMMEKEVQKVIEMQMQMERQGSGGSQQPSQSQTPNQDHLSPGDEPQQSSSSSQQLPLASHATQRARTDSVSTAISDDMVEIDFPLGKLNDSKRIDYVLQEAPLEFINEYIFALSSHVCYWDSEDTILFVMKEIYSGLGISPDSQVPQQTMTIERPSSRNSLSQS